MFLAHFPFSKICEPLFCIFFVQCRVTHKLNGRGLAVVGGKYFCKRFFKILWISCPCGKLCVPCFLQDGSVFGFGLLWYWFCYIWAARAERKLWDDIFPLLQQSEEHQWPRCRTEPKDHWNYAGMVPECYWNYTTMRSKWCLNAFEIAPKWSWNCARLMINWCQNDAAMTPEWCWRDARIALKWCQTHAGVVSKRWGNDAIMM